MPAYGTDTAAYPAAQANDGDYTTVWRAAPPTFLAYDLSSVPAAQRQKVDVAWYNEDSGQYDNTLIGDNAYNVPAAYTIDANAAPGGGVEPPADGWITLVSVTGNTMHSRQHLLDLHCANWIRMNVTAVNAWRGCTDAQRRRPP